MLFKSIASLSAIASLVAADNLFPPGHTVNRNSLAGLNIDPPATANLIGAYYAKGIRYHECVPTHPVHLKWYNVQTTATLYDQPNVDNAIEVATMSFAPMNLTKTEVNSESRYPVFYNLKDGSFAVLGNPKNTTRNMGHHDESYIDDHITPVVHTSDSGAWKDVQWIVRANSSQSAPPPEDLCTEAGALLLRPYEAMYLFFTDSEPHSYPSLRVGKKEAGGQKPTGQNEAAADEPAGNAEVDADEMEA
ncbi:hypothetical protein K450DRAFT_254504 [Umbelopsis ramanniana AG]|uniref:Uncharacterized protein n=1 Tax=Umbelopsis ramanniana AG TaxID=1314678 RepID=A0AAD5HAI8_UMBRA|nr:uncharacterized protein K450DRAFT_254504 [Umbelopsis ramanniana AG]KAI8576977.1 hypothetical protein K450DRAFT_254504 [Umbelopsis ramanniana AG]